MVLGPLYIIIHTAVVPNPKFVICHMNRICILTPFIPIYTLQK